MGILYIKSIRHSIPKISVNSLSGLQMIGYENLSVLIAEMLQIHIQNTLPSVMFLSELLLNCYNSLRVNERIGYKGQHKICNVKWQIQLGELQQHRVVLIFGTHVKCRNMKIFSMEEREAKFGTRKANLGMQNFFYIGTWEREGKI